METNNLNCPYCLEFVHKASKPILYTIGWPYRTRVLYQTDLTVIAPTIGSIIPNYLLLVPLRHTFAIQYLNSDEIEDLSNCVSMLEDRFDEGTFFEHGSLDTQRLAGASVDHVHLHYLPINIDLKALTPELEYVEVLTLQIMYPLYLTKDIPPSSQSESRSRPVM